MDSKVHRVCVLFAQMWKGRFHEDYIIVRGFDHKYATEIQDVPLDEITRRLSIYLNDDWYVQHCKCSLQAFVKNFNKFVPQQKKSKPSAKTTQLISCSDCGQSLTLNDYHNHICEPTKVKR